MSDVTFLVLFLGLTAVMAVFPLAMKRAGVPSVISLLVVGMLVGDTGIGLDLIPRLARAIDFLVGSTAGAAETARAFTLFIDKLGALGLMFLMALAGMEADFKLVGTCRKPVMWLSVLTFFVPAAGGFFLYRHYFPEAVAGQVLYASLFASHSVGIVFPVMRELGLTRTRFGVSVLVATVVTDVASILLLAVAVQLQGQVGAAGGVGSLSILERHAEVLGGHYMAVFAAAAALYVVVAVLGVRRIGRAAVRRVGPGEDVMVTLMLLIILFAALAGELVGINFIVGSFIAGLGLSRVVRQQDMRLFRRFESIGYGFLIPFLFVSIGMKTDFRVFARPGSVEIIVLTIAVLVGTKLLSGYAALRACGFGRRAGLAAGLMTVPQLSATLTAAAIGKGLGILDERFFNAVIVLSIVTTLPVPSMVRALLFKRGVRRGNAGTGDFAIPDVVQDEDLL
ncbi:MAG: cation:proton antiporter [Kiritimatiellae bacterium]|nr:cation:proton antiporter [Kiritimatiellia bacterium]